MIGLEGLKFQIPARGNVEIYRRGTLLFNQAYNEDDPHSIKALICISDKQSGVEPGFLALKFGKAFAKQTKANILLLLNANNSSDDSESDTKQLKRLLIEHFKKNKKLLAELHKQNLIQDVKKITDIEIKSVVTNWPDEKVADFYMANPAIADYITGKIIIDFGTKSDLAYYQELTTKYFIKQDYNDPARGDDKVTVPQYRAENTNTAKKFGVFRKVYALFYRFQRRRSRDEENLNAIREVLSTEIACQWSARTHQQALCFGTYHDRHPKFLTISEWQDGVAPLTTGLHTTIKGGSYRYGNYLATMDPKTGKYVSDQSLVNLGQRLTDFLALYDPDGMGSRGDNKLKIPRPGSDTEFDLFYIDMGQCLRGKNPLVDLLQDDFSMQLPILSPFKNFSVLYDTLLSDKMKGIHILNKLRHGVMPPAHILDEYDEEFKETLSRIVEDSDLDVFDKYITELQNLAKSATSSKDKYNAYADEIETARTNYLESTHAILKVFRHRINLSPNELDFLNNMEKLTSRSSIYSPDGSVRLKHLRVEPNSRVAWQLTKTDNIPDSEYTLTTIASVSNEAERIKTRIVNYLKFANQKQIDVEINANKIAIKFSANNFSKLQQIFNEPHITTLIEREDAARKRSSRDLDKVIDEENILKDELKTVEEYIKQFKEYKVTKTSSLEEIQIFALQLSTNLFNIHHKAINKQPIDADVQHLLEKVAEIKNIKAAELEKIIRERCAHEKAVSELQELKRTIVLCCIYPEEEFNNALKRLKKIADKADIFAARHKIITTPDGRCFVDSKKEEQLELGGLLHSVYSKINDKRNEVLLNHLPIGLLNTFVKKSKQRVYQQWEEYYFNKNPALKDFRRQMNHALMIYTKEISILKIYKEALLSANVNDLHKLKKFLHKHQPVTNLLYKYRVDLKKAETDFMAYQDKVLRSQRKLTQQKNSYYNARAAFFQPARKPTTINTTSILTTIWNALKIW